MKTPNLTSAQIVSSALAVIGLLVTQGAVTNETGKLIGGLASILIPTIWIVADAIIRHGRSNVAAAQLYETPPPTISSDAVFAEQVKDA